MPKIFRLHIGLSVKYQSSIYINLRIENKLDNYHPIKLVYLAIYDTTDRRVEIDKMELFSGIRYLSQDESPL